MNTTDYIIPGYRIDLFSPPDFNSMPLLRDMHRRFGKVSGKQCHSCPLLIRHKRLETKCRCMEGGGNWHANWTACGKVEEK